jgi:hypothetical protein
MLLTTVTTLQSLACGAAMAGEEEPDSLAVFQDLLKDWDLTRNIPEGREDAALTPEPSDVVHRMANLFEKETNVYMAKDPDPFEERHPSRVDPTCQLGQLLKAFFKKEELVSVLFKEYLKENRHFELKVAACRLVLDILPGLEIAVLQVI